MSTLQIRIDEKVKNEARDIFEKLGMDMTTGITLYLHQVIRTKGVPIPLLTENGLTETQEGEINAAALDARMNKNISKSLSGEEALEYLDSL